MTRRIHDGSLLLGWFSPQEKHDIFLLVAHFLDDIIGKRLPALLFMRIRLVGTHSQTGIEEQHALLSPVHQRTVLWNGETEVAVDFRVNVAKRGRNGNALVH